MHGPSWTQLQSAFDAYRTELARMAVAAQLPVTMTVGLFSETAQVLLGPAIEVQSIPGVGPPTVKGCTNFGAAFNFIAQDIEHAAPRCAMCFVMFLTDGEEAPRLHAFNTKNLAEFQGGNDWLFVGIGTAQGAPIPKYDEKNQLIGYWSNDSFALQPGVAQISEQNFGARDDSVAGGLGDRFVSKLSEGYLQSVAKEVNANYVRGDSLQSVQAAMRQQKPARRDIAPFQLDWVLALLAGFTLLLAYVPKHPWVTLRTALKKSRIAGRLGVR
jgi:hypothetical protein